MYYSRVLKVLIVSKWGQVVYGLGLGFGSKAPNSILVIVIITVIIVIIIPIRISIEMQIKIVIVVIILKQHCSRGLTEIQTTETNTHMAHCSCLLGGSWSCTKSL